MENALQEGEFYKIHIFFKKSQWTAPLCDVTGVGWEGSALPPSR